MAGHPDLNKKNRFVFLRGDRTEFFRVLPSSACVLLLFCLVASFMMLVLPQFLLEGIPRRQQQSNSKYSAIR
uniref:Uncharacterized protein n=1 Tax=Rhizophora mucronata TaxID=61149 RepID=A0A2P2LS25_RHIMU